MTENYTLGDIAAVTGGNRNNDGWGGDNSWWIVLFLIFGLFGWGGNGFGGFGGNAGAGQGGYDTRADLQRGFDNQAVIGKLDGITQGLCDGFYAQNSALMTGFNGVQNTLCQGFNGVNTQISNIGFQLQDCCCQTQRAIDGVRYDMATQACDTRNTIQNTTRDIIDNQNANSRAILDFLTNDKIATLTAENQSLKLAASQAAQNAFITANQEAQTAELIRRLGADCPQPAYVVQPPTPVNFPVNGCGNFGGYNYGSNCGYNSGCNC